MRRDDLVAWLLTCENDGLEFIRFPPLASRL
jgi:hypothetical protein